MGDLDCGNCDLNCGDCGDCNCNCNDCGCGDCNCNDCGCGDCNCCDCSSCFDNCCTGETDVILCCFPPLTGGTNNPRHSSTTPADCFCCCRGERMPTSSNKSKRKGFCRRLRSCFRSHPSPPSSPSRDQPKTETALPTGYGPDISRYPMKDGFGSAGPNTEYNHTQEDGRYPMSEGQFGYKGQHWDQGHWEERDMSSRDHAMDWKWSKPVRHGENKYGGHL